MDFMIIYGLSTAAVTLIGCVVMISKVAPRNTIVRRRLVDVKDIPKDFWRDLLALYKEETSSCACACTYLAPLFAGRHATSSQAGAALS